MTVNFVVVSDLKYVWDVIISICSKALRQVIRRMSSKFSNFAEPNPKKKMAENTDKWICRELISMLKKYGVNVIVASPGSRNAPLLVAAARENAIEVIPVADERSAAFIALGSAAVSDAPVAIICTSGTAVLNYGPAVAEAFYRALPLIVISADRPYEWIDQDDSQTIRQPGTFANFTKGSYDLNESVTDADKWYANRMINDAMTLALSGRKGPVHINVRLDSPLGRQSDSRHLQPRKIATLRPREDLTVGDARVYGRQLASPRKVMIIAGFMTPDSRLNQALGRLARLPNFVVMTETIANMHNPAFISRIDTTLSQMTDDDRHTLKPDVVITLGGALVSRHIKDYIRSIDNAEHWSVGHTHTTVDCFRHLSLRIEMRPEVFFPQLASAMQPHQASCDYSRRWELLARKAEATHRAYVGSAPWSDMRAFSVFMPMIPRNANLQLSNGTAVRYAQLFATRDYHRCDCNRGVSGIDGCTSTAIGAAMAYPGITVLVTGDMSAQYDVGALAYASLAPRLRIIVMRNGGGAIFRFVESTCYLDELEKYFAHPRQFPARQIAEAYGLDYFEAADEQSLRGVFRQFLSAPRAALLAVDTPAEESARILRNYFNRKSEYINHKQTDI